VSFPELRKALTKFGLPLRGRMKFLYEGLMPPGHNGVGIPIDSFRFLDDWTVEEKKPDPKAPTESDPHTVGPGDGVEHATELFQTLPGSRRGPRLPQCVYTGSPHEEQTFRRVFSLPDLTPRPQSTQTTRTTRAKSPASLSTLPEDLKPRRWANALGSFRATRDPLSMTPWRAVDHAPRPKAEGRRVTMLKK